MEPLEGEEDAMNSTSVDLESSVILNSRVNRSGLVRSNPSSMEASVNRQIIRSLSVLFFVM